jgi:hypothetical protein
MIVRAEMFIAVNLNPSGTPNVENMFTFTLLMQI